MPRLPSRALLPAKVLALAGAIATAVAFASTSRWNVPLFLGLVALAVVGDWAAPVSEKAKIHLSGSFLALVLSAVFLGPAPAAALGLVTAIAHAARWRVRLEAFVHNAMAFAWFPLVGAVAFDAARDATGATPDQRLFYVLVLGTFAFTNLVNLVLIGPGLDWAAWRDMLRRVVVPSLPSQVIAAVLTVGVAALYVAYGLEALALVAVVLVAFLALLGRLLLSEERADELERRSNQLASLQVGLLSALLRTLDLRDRMTARHSAAVARYAREIAAAAGLSEEEQELVHTAGLLHDIGKFIFPDHILKADTPLSDEDWNIIRTHPYQGARIVSQVDGYGPVGEIVLAHHERIDGKGYPRGLSGEEIPKLSRIISVADVYDVITARDSYRDPVSSFEAIQELRRVAGTQLDPHFVNVFVELLAGRDVRYRHGEDADFESELALEKRVHAYAAPRPGDDLPAAETRDEDADGGLPAVGDGEQPARETSSA